MARMRACVVGVAALIVAATAWAPQATAYVTNNVANKVQVIDVASASVSATTSVGTAPSSIAVRPDGQRVFVTNHDSSSMSVLSPSGVVLATTAIAGTPTKVAVSNDGQYVLVTTNEGSLVVLDSTGTEVLETLALGGTPGGMAVAATGNFAAITLSSTNSVVIVNLPPAPASGSQIPVAALQQYVPEPGDACGAHVPDSADFPALTGLRAQGWGTSWAQWPNDGAGGPVCTRQPFYTSGGSWSVRSRRVAARAH